MLPSKLQFVKVDVSDLTPPEPMTVILKHLSTLTADQCLVITHRRQPYPLYEKLTNAGFSYHCVVKAQDAVLLYVFHHNSSPLFKQLLASQQLPERE